MQSLCFITVCLIIFSMNYNIYREVQCITDRNKLSHDLNPVYIYYGHGTAKIMARVPLFLSTVQLIFTV